MLGVKRNAVSIVAKDFLEIRATDYKRLTHKEAV
jgi:hypothetical protein